MTREEAVEFARQAGHPQPNMDGLFHQRVANLVAAAEREACAKSCEECAKRCEDEPTNNWERSLECAATIRARSQS